MERRFFGLYLEDDMFWKKKPASIEIIFARIKEIRDETVDLRREINWVEQKTNTVLVHRKGYANASTKKFSTKVDI